MGVKTNLCILFIALKSLKLLIVLTIAKMIRQRPMDDKILSESLFMGLYSSFIPTKTFKIIIQKRKGMINNSTPKLNEYKFIINSIWQAVYL